MTATRRRFHLDGTVQGVGMRPHVVRLARAAGVAGTVGNCADGVRIEVEGDEGAVADFRTRLLASPPPRAEVRSWREDPVAPRGETGFRVIASDEPGPGATVQIGPDLATCATCLRELLDPGDRRYRHPFISCTDCGPRYTILRHPPFDRANTAMAGFAMCPACRAEYEDPHDRRFHAETICCPRCGPRLALRDRAGTRLAGDDAALARAVDALLGGRILALKGLGGYQLVCDATDAEAVARLRARKARPSQPLAVMVADVAAARTLVDLDDAALATMGSATAPIVCAPRLPAAPVVEEIAPGIGDLGVFLPTTALHHLLVGDCGRPLVCTSGNRHDEPPCLDADEARARLGDVADLFLDHDRAILRRVDDGVVRRQHRGVQVLRGGRGRVPSRFLLVDVDPGPALLATGGHLKNAPALLVGGAAVPAPHLGDLEDARAEAAFAAAVDDLCALHGAAPERIVCDAHPDYATTRWAEGRGLPVHRVQHHLAHVGACLVEHDRGFDPAVLGIVWDGAGYGRDGGVWGGEWIAIENRRAHRAAHLLPFPLPGGDAAARAPWRIAWALCRAIGRDFAPPADVDPVLLARAVERGVNSPRCTGVGRLFDGVAALCGFDGAQTYEGEAPSRLEALADARDADPYPFALVHGDPCVVDWRPAIAAICRDRDLGRDPAAVAAGFHAGLALAAAEVATAIGIPTVALTGGCFANRRLAGETAAALDGIGCRVLEHRRIPPGDGGLAIGQLAIAAAGVAWEDD